MAICPRCGGRGDIPQYAHVAGGVCFLCMGSGEITGESVRDSFFFTGGTIENPPSTESQPYVRSLIDNPANFSTSSDIWQTREARAFGARAAQELGLDINQTRYLFRDIYGEQDPFFIQSRGQTFSRFSRAPMGGTTLAELTFQELAREKKVRFGEPYKTVSRHTKETEFASPAWEYMHSTATRMGALQKATQYVPYSDKNDPTKMVLGGMELDPSAIGIIPGYSIEGDTLITGTTAEKLSKRAKTAMSGNTLFLRNLPRQVAGIAPFTGGAPTINVMQTAVLMHKGLLPSGQSYYDPIAIGSAYRARAVSITLPDELPDDWTPGITEGQQIGLGETGWFDVAPGVRGHISAAESFTPQTWGINTTYKTVGGRQVRNRTLVIQGEADYGGHYGMKLYSKAGGAATPDLASWNITAGTERVDVQHLLEMNEPAQMAYAIAATWSAEQRQAAFGKDETRWRPGMETEVWEYLKATKQLQSISWEQQMYLGPVGGELEPQLRTLESKGYAEILSERAEGESRFGTVKMTGYGYAGPMAQLGVVNWPYHRRQISGEELRRTELHDPMRARAIRRYSDRFRQTSANIAGSVLATQGVAPEYRAVPGESVLSKWNAIKAQAEVMAIHDVPFELREGIEMYGIHGRIMQMLNEVTGDAGISFDLEKLGLGTGNLVLPNAGSALSMFGRGSEVEGQAFGALRTIPEMIEGMYQLEQDPNNQKLRNRVLGRIRAYQKQMSKATSSPEMRRRLDAYISPGSGGQIQASPALAPAEAWIPEKRLASMLREVWGIDDFGGRELASLYDSPEQAARAFMGGEGAIPDPRILRWPIGESWQTNVGIRLLNEAEAARRFGDLSSEQLQGLGTRVSPQIAQLMSGDWDIDPYMIRMGMKGTFGVLDEMNRFAQERAISGIGAELQSTQEDIREGPSTIEQAYNKVMQMLKGGRMSLADAVKGTQQFESGKSMMGPAYNAFLRALPAMIRRGSKTPEEDAELLRLSEKMISEVGAPLYMLAQDATKLPASARRLLSHLTYNVESSGYRKASGGPGMLSTIIASSVAAWGDIGTDQNVSPEVLAAMFARPGQEGFSELQNLFKQGSLQSGAIVNILMRMSEARGDENPIRGMIENSPWLRMAVGYGYYKGASRSTEFAEGLDEWEQIRFAEGRALRQRQELLTKGPSLRMADISQSISNMQELLALGLVSESEALDFIDTLQRSGVERSKRKPRKPSRVIATDDQSVLNYLRENVPGLGGILTDRISTLFTGEVHAVASNEPEAFRAIRGIGPKKQARITAAMRKYNKGGVTKGLYLNRAGNVVSGVRARLPQIEPMAVGTGPALAVADSGLMMPETPPVEEEPIPDEDLLPDVEPVERPIDRYKRALFGGSTPGNETAAWWKLVQEAKDRPYGTIAHFREVDTSLVGDPDARAAGKEYNESMGMIFEEDQPGSGFYRHMYVQTLDARDKQPGPQEVPAHHGPAEIFLKKLVENKAVTLAPLTNASGRPVTGRMVVKTGRIVMNDEYIRERFARGGFARDFKFHGGILPGRPEIKTLRDAYYSVFTHELGHKEQLQEMGEKAFRTWWKESVYEMELDAQARSVRMMYGREAADEYVARARELNEAKKAGVNQSGMPEEPPWHYAGEGGGGTGGGGGDDDDDLIVPESDNPRNEIELMAAVRNTLAEYENLQKRGWWTNPEGRNIRVLPKKARIREFAFMADIDPDTALIRDPDKLRELGTTMGRVRSEEPPTDWRDVEAGRRLKNVVSAGSRLSTNLRDYQRAQRSFKAQWETYQSIAAKSQIDISEETKRYRELVATPIPEIDVQTALLESVGKQLGIGREEFGYTWYEASEEATVYGRMGRGLPTRRDEETVLRSRRETALLQSLVDDPNRFSSIEELQRFALVDQGLAVGSKVMGTAYALAEGTALNRGQAGQLIKRGITPPSGPGGRRILTDKQIAAAELRKNEINLLSDVFGGASRFGDVDALQEYAIGQQGIPASSQAVRIASARIRGEELTDAQRGKLREYGIVPPDRPVSDAIEDPYEKMRGTALLSGIASGSFRYGNINEFLESATSEAKWNLPMESDYVRIGQKMAGGQNITGKDARRLYELGIQIPQAPTDSIQDPEKELAGVTQALIASRKTAVKNTAASSRAEKDLAENTIASAAQRQYAGILRGLEREGGMEAVAAFVTSPSARVFRQELERGQEISVGTAAFDLAKRVASPFSRERAMVSRAWMYSGAKQTFEEYIPAAIKRDMAISSVAVQAGGYAPWTSGMGYEMAVRQAGIAESKAMAGQVAFQAYGLGPQMGQDLRNMQALISPALGVGAGVGLGAYFAGSAFAGSAGLVGAAGTALAGAALPIGIAAGAGALAYGAYNYGSAQLGGAPQAQLSALRTAEEIGQASEDMDFWALATNLIKVGATGIFGAEEGAGIRGVFDFRGKMDLQRENVEAGRRLLGTPFSELGAGQRAAVLQDQATIMRDQVPGMGAYTPEKIAQAIGEIAKFTPGVNWTDQDFADPEFRNQIKRMLDTGTGPAQYQQFTQSLGGRGPADVVNMERYINRLGLDEANRSSFMQQMGTWGFLSGAGATPRGIGNITQNWGGLTNQGQRAVQGYLSNNRLLNTQIFEGSVPSGLTPELEQALFQDPSLARLETGTYLPIGTSRDFGQIFRNMAPGNLQLLNTRARPMLGNAIAGAAMLGGNADISGAIKSQFADVGFVQDWTGESLMDLQDSYTATMQGYRRDQQAQQWRDFRFRYGGGTGWQTADDLGGIYQQQRQLGFLSRDLGYARQEGGAINVGGQAFNFTGQFNFQAQSIAQSYAGSLASIGNQSAMLEANRGWQLTQRGYAQQDLATNRIRGEWGFQQQEISMGLARDQAATMFSWNEQGMKRQAYGMALGREQTILQRGWQAADFADTRATSQLQFGWQMEDMDESIRFSQGRQRSTLVRQRERAVTMQNISEERLDDQESRANKLNELEDERYQLQEESLQAQMEQLVEQREWQTEAFELEEEQFEKKKEWQDDDWQTAEKRLKARGEHEDKIYGLQKQSARDQRKQLEENHALQVAQLNESIAYYEAQKIVAAEAQLIQDKIDVQQATSQEAQLTTATAMAAASEAWDALTLMIDTALKMDTTGTTDRLTTMYQKMMEMQTQGTLTSMITFFNAVTNANNSSGFGGGCP